MSIDTDTRTRVEEASEMITELRAKRSKRRRTRVELCETCGVACDARCRARAARERAVDRALEGGVVW
jgi:heterodisulfide reductase subunit A-like polyferredoxin